MVTWMTSAARNKAKGSYLNPGETVSRRFKDIARHAASYYDDEDKVIEKGILTLLMEGILAPSTPVWSNFGRTKGLPISCYGSVIEDNLHSIFDYQTQAAMLGKNGGGTSVYMGHIRPRGAVIGHGGYSNGVVPWLEVNKNRVEKVSQGGIRRGAEAAYVEFSSPDLIEVLQWRRENPDYNIGVNVRDTDLKQLEDGDMIALGKWQRILKERLETGEPYLIFIDKANRLSPFDEPILASNLCSEILIPSNNEETFVCCLSSLNAATHAKWADTQAVFYSTLFLDAVMQEFIDKTAGKSAYDKARKSAVKYRTLGLGLLGLHTAFQQEMLPFDSMPARTLSTLLTKHMQEESYKASLWIAAFKGVPEGCISHGRRNATTMAIAPNTNSAFLCGEVSRGIEPILANYTIQTQDKKTIERKNLTLKQHLVSIRRDTAAVWARIAEDSGSVQNLEFLSDEARKVFRTAYEIDQASILQMANARGRYIDQSQSLNLFLTSQSTPEEIHELHKYAAMSPYIKSLYYCRSKKGVRAEGCEACAS